MSIRDITSENQDAAMPSTPEPADIDENNENVEDIEGIDNVEIGDVDEIVDAPMMDEDVDGDEVNRVAASGDHIGDYRIIRTVSESPTSVIYKAEEKGTKRRVAIKVIFNRPDAVTDSLKRTDEEIERLKHLNHPGIVAFMDIGRTQEGHCYFVNEFVRGVPLDEYIKIHKLSLQNRLTLFMKICDAVAYAHQHLLLHRDLRPSKIVIDGKCNPKIVGLGVAAVTNVDVESMENSDDPELKAFLAYKSPEQITGKLVGIDVRSDLYSLGVILYELLTEQLPFGLDSCKYGDIVKNVCKNRPRMPGSARRSMGDDLTAIVQKSLEKDPNARYKTVAALQQDLQNYFEQRPVQARPAGALYEFRKLVARHKSRSISVLLMSVAVIGFGAHIHLTTRQAGRQLIQQEREKSATEITKLATAKELAEMKLADAEKAFDAKMAEYEEFDTRLTHFKTELARAEQDGAALRVEVADANSKAETSQEVTQFFVDLFRMSGAAKADRARMTVADMLDAGVKQVSQRFGSRPVVQAALSDALGVAYQNLGLYANAAEQIKAALDTRRQALGETHEDTIDSMNNLASTLFSEGKLREAEPLCRRIVTATRQAFGTDDPRTLTAMNNLGMTLYSLDKHSEAESILRETLEGRRRAYGSDHRKTVMTAYNLGRVLFDQNKPAEAVTLFRETLDAKRRQLGDNHLEVSAVMLQLAEALMANGDPTAAEPMIQQCLNIREKALPKRHWLIPFTKGALGVCLADRGQFELAEPLLLSSHARIREIRGSSDEFTQKAVQRIIDLYEAWDKPQKAAEFRSRLQ